MNIIIFLLALLVGIMSDTPIVYASENASAYQVEDSGSGGEDRFSDGDSSKFAHPTVNGRDVGIYGVFKQFWDFLDNTYLPIPIFHFTFLQMIETVLIATVIVSLLVKFIQEIGFSD